MGGQGGPSDKYTLSTDKTVYNMSSPTVSVTINGGDFTGYLLGASTGTFPSCTRSTRCDENTCSHRNTNTVTDGTAFVWRASSCETVNFRAILHDAQTQAMYRTETITLTCNGGSDDSSASKLMASVLVVLLSVFVSFSTVLC